MNKFRELLTSYGLLWLRVLAGLGIAYHGYQKVFEGGAARLTEGVVKWGWPMPEFFAWAAALSEFGGGVLILLGLGTRVGAFFVFVTMTVAAFFQHHGQNFSNKEKALAYWAVAGALMLTGAGKLSLDALVLPKLFKRKKG